MPKISVNHDGMDQDRNQHFSDEPVYHDRYDVRIENGRSVGINLLSIYYGKLWLSAMSRLNHKIDGHLFDIKHQGMCYRVYRKLRPMKVKAGTHLRLVKKE